MKKVRPAQVWPPELQGMETSSLWAMVSRKALPTNGVDRVTHNRSDCVHHLLFKMRKYTHLGKIFI